MKYLAHEDGFLGLYRGFLPRAASVVLSNLITQCVSSTPIFKRNTDRLTLGKHQNPEKSAEDSFLILIKDVRLYIYLQIIYLNNTNRTIYRHPRKWLQDVLVS